MNGSGRSLPRFVPTLTEVVSPATVTHARSGGASATDRPEPDVQSDVDANVQAIAQQAQRQIQVMIDQKLNAARGEMLLAVHGALSQAWDDLRRALNADLEGLIQQAVLQAIQTDKQKK